MIIGGRVDPYLHRSDYLALKHDGEDEAGDGDDRQRRPPAGRQRRTDDWLSSWSGRKGCHKFIQSWDNVGVFAGTRRKSGAGAVGGFVTGTPLCDGPRGPPAVSCQPIPLTISGPRQVATASGSRFQSAMSTPNLGLRGLRSGSLWPAARRY